MVGNARRYTLTDKVEGKTRCLYVPVSMEAEVRPATSSKTRDPEPDPTVGLAELCRQTPAPRTPRLCVRHFPHPANAQEHVPPRIL